MADSLGDLARQWADTIKELTKAANDYQKAKDKREPAEKKVDDLTRQLFRDPDDADLRRRRDKAEDRFREAERDEAAKKGELGKKLQQFTEAQERFMRALWSSLTK
jgi:hypothetical protein